MTIFSSHAFLTSASSIVSGNSFKIPGGVNPLATMDIAISGDRTSNTILFKGKGDIGEYVAILAKNRTTGNSASQTTLTTDEIWTIPLAGLRYVNCEVEAILGEVNAVGIVVI